MKTVVELLKKLVGVRSVTGTVEERDVARKIYDLIAEDPYFLEHPDHFGLWDGGDALGRPVVWALKRGSGRRTVVFSGHYDTVGTACYGVFEPYALDPDALKSAMSKNPPEDDDIRRDLADENWMFGRGTADMKAGLALNLHALMEHVPGGVNVLATFVSDEENLSAGARQAVGLYALLQERFGLDYTLAVISEPIEREPGAPHPFIGGSAGKILPVVVARGIPAHSASMLRGVNSAHLIANVIRETEYDTAFLSQGGSLFTEPPAVQLVRDLKEGYDVSMPEYTVAAFNMTFFCGTDPVALMGRLLENCRKAADELLRRYDDCLDDMESSGRIGPNRRKRFSVRVMTLQDLEADLSARGGFEAYRREAKARSEQIAASGETLLWASALYIRDIMAFAGGGPMVVAGIAPPYYPAVNNDFLKKDIAPIVEDTIAMLKREHGIRVEREDYSQAMMDLSYMSCANPDSARRIMGNVPLPECLYRMDVDAMTRLEIPTLIIGPARKEIHQLGERVYLPDVERDLPIIFRQIIRSAENTYQGDASMNHMHLPDRWRDEIWAMEQFEAAEFVYVAVNGEDGVPYNVPLCVVRVGEALYFHTALQGHALDLFRRDGRVCVSCTTYTQRDAEHTTLLFRSAMAFGTVSEVTDTEEKRQIMTHYFEKYLQGDEKAAGYAVRASTRAAVWRVKIREATGKENKGE